LEFAAVTYEFKHTVTKVLFDEVTLTSILKGFLPGIPYFPSSSHKARGIHSQKILEARLQGIFVAELL